jgi:hypothetical protein
MKRFLMFFLAAAFICQAGCSKNDSATLILPDDGNNRLFTAVKATTPAFAATSSKAQMMQAGVMPAPVFSDPAMLVAFQLLRNYTYPDDEGRVDMTNIYKVLWEAGGSLDDATSVCSSMPEAADSAISPYAFSDFLGHTYTCGGNRGEAVEAGYGKSIAYKKDGADEYMLMSYKWAPDAAQQIAIGVIQAQYNGTTNDVGLRFAQSVYYPPDSVMGGPAGNGFATRTSITGNSGTHAFELKIAINTTSLVGKGISRGAGNYFLLRSGSDYYCIPAGATETDLAGMTPTDLAGVSADCAGYKDAVSAMTPYDVSTDLPNIDLSDFNDGVSGTPVNYLMF